MRVSETITAPVVAAYHPIPWQVVHWQRFDEWHPKSCPKIVDANGDTVCYMPQHVGHPGEYDVKADLAAITIVDCVNAASGSERCPECGYTEQDCRTHGDHHLCERHPFFSWEDKQ